MASCDKGSEELCGLKDNAESQCSVSDNSDFLLRVEAKTDPHVCTLDVDASRKQTAVLDDPCAVVGAYRSTGDSRAMEQTRSHALSGDRDIEWENSCAGLKTQTVGVDGKGGIVNHYRENFNENGTPGENVEAQCVQDRNCVDREGCAVRQNSDCTEEDKFTRGQEGRTEVAPACGEKGSSSDAMEAGQCSVEGEAKNSALLNSALYSEIEIQKSLTTTSDENPVTNCDILSSDLYASDTCGDHRVRVNSSETNQLSEHVFSHSSRLDQDSSSAIGNQTPDVHTATLINSGNFSSSLEVVKPGVEASRQNSMDSIASGDVSVTKHSDEKEASHVAHGSSDNFSAEGADTSTSTPVKILTQYVFIKKPQKKVAKKQFGVTYRRGFHHFQGMDQKLLLFAKIMKKKKMSRAKAVAVLRHLNLEGLFKSKALSYVNGAKALSKLDNAKSQKRRCQTKSRSQKKAKAEKRAAKARGKSPVREEKVSKRAKRYPVRSAEKHQKSDKLPNKKRESKRKETAGRKKSKLGSRRGPLRFEDKLGILQALDDPTATVESVGEEFGVSTGCVMKVYKKKDEILTKAQSREDNKGKKEGRQQMKVKREKEAVKEMEVKMEQDADVENDAGLDLFFSEFQGGKYSQRRNGSSRKDLTLEEKVNVIHALQTPGTKIVTLAKKFGVSSSAISRLNKNKELVLSKAASGDLSTNQRRARECKDPELDRALLKWYRAIESLNFVEPPLSISNTLLKEKVKELAVAMGKSYFPSDNWILRWKNRHNLLSKSRMICDREQLAQLDTNVDMADIISEFPVYGVFMQREIPAIKEEDELPPDSQTNMKKEEFYICEHCGVVTNNKKDKKRNNHLKACPSSQHRKDLTLEEKAQVVKALEKPGVKMVSLAKKYGVSASAISRIHKNRVDILARCASSNANVSRRRDRGSKEPEVEKSLCDWYRLQHELGVHVSGSMIRDRAREIARLMGKDFWPSDSWVFRWRMRNNVNAMNSFFDCDDEEEEEGEEVKDGDNDMDNLKSGLEEGKEEQEDDVELDGEDGNKRKVKVEDVESVPVTKKCRRGPRSVMCEKCGYVSCQLKNNRIKNMRHAKGCPDLKPRNELTYENRAKMLKALEEPGATLSSVARQFGVSVSSMSRMNQKKDEILSHGMDHGNQKRIRESKEPEVGRQLYSWYMEKQGEGIHITGPKLKEKASKLAQEMGREFKVSSGWLGRWRHRFNIVGKPRDGRRVSPVKKKMMKKENNGPASRGELMVPLPLAPMEVPHESMTAVVNVVNPEPVPATAAAPPARMLLHQRFQSPWEMPQQPASCSRGMEFVAPQGPAVAEDTNHIAYAYSETVPRHVFHNMFDSFTTVPTVGYQVPITDAGMVVGRDYLQGDDDGGVDHHHHHHHQHQHQAQQQQQPQHQPMQNHPHHPSPSGSHPSMPHVAASPVGLTSGQVEEDGEQQRQIMDAFKIMSSFAQKKSLGDQVQAALRTIELSMKSPARKPSSRNTYTAI